MKCGTVTIIGRPNTGKSTLLNAFVGQKISIVSAKPQTTRHRILGILTEGRGQIAFVDTPGIHKPNYRMNQRMLKTVYDSINGVDLVLHVVDASIAFGSGENFVLDVIKKIKPKAILLINKIDKVAKQSLLPIMDRYYRQFEYLEILPISALKKDNLNLLTDRLFDYLPEGEELYDSRQVTDQSERFLSAEFIREKLLERTREEIPYATAVRVRRFDESRRDSKKLVVIEADIVVEKRSQQGIILGAGGLQLRNIGISARRDLEQLLDCKIYLDLNVCTVKDWRNNDSLLDELGL